MIYRRGGGEMPPVKIVIITLLLLGVCQLIARTGFGIW